MKKPNILSVLCSLLLAVVLLQPMAYAAPNLTAEIVMDVRAETATAAKKEATDSAMRSSIIQILSRYSDRSVVENLMMASDDTLFQNMVASTSIASEKQSKTAYGAKFTITLDRNAVEKWYAENNVPNFLSAADESKDKTIIYIGLENGLQDWAALNQLVRDSGENYGLTLRSIFEKSATAYVLSGKRRALQNLATSAGWTVSVRDGIIGLSKKSAAVSAE